MRTRLILGPIILAIVALIFWGDYALVSYGSGDDSLGWLTSHPWGFILLATFALTVCAYEVMNLMDASGLKCDRLPVFLGLIAAIALSLGGDLSAIAFVAPFFLIFLGAQAIWNPDVKSFATRFAGSLAAFSYVAIPAAAVVSLREFGYGLHDGLWLIIFLVVTNRLGADSCAYFAGKAFGKRKLIPHVSPKKTVEGLIGGVVGSIGLAYLCAWLLPDLVRNFSASPPGANSGDAYWMIGLVGLMIGLLAPVGDLVASALKRSAGAKDSGKLLPEFGGILDLIDGLLLTGPFLLLILHLLQRSAMLP